MYYCNSVLYGISEAHPLRPLQSVLKTTKRGGATHHRQEDARPYCHQHHALAAIETTYRPTVKTVFAGQCLCHAARHTRLICAFHYRRRPLAHVHVHFHRSRSDLMIPRYRLSRYRSRSLCMSVVLQLGTLYLQPFKTYLHNHPVSAAISKLNCLAGRVALIHRSTYVLTYLLISM